MAIDRRRHGMSRFDNLVQSACAVRIRPHPLHQQLALAHDDRQFIVEVMHQNKLNFREFQGKLVHVQSALLV